MQTARPPTPSVEAAASTSSPCIPPELVSLILAKLWEAPLSSYERSASLRNIVLVNRTWHALIAPIVSRNVHIFNYQHARALSRSIYARHDHRESFIGDPMFLAREICHSLTLHINGNPLCADLSKATPAFWESLEFNQTIATLMYSIQSYNKLPTLRHVSIRYTDWSYDDIVTQAEYGLFPKQVTHLSVHYSFTAPAAAPSVETPIIKQWVGYRGYRHTQFMCIRHLSLSGMPMKFMTTLVTLCPHMETLEIAHPSQLAVLAPLPATLRTLVLCFPGVAVCRETMVSWALDTALDAGLFRKKSAAESTPRVVLRSSTPDPAAFTELRRACRAFEVDFVYERDDSGTRIRTQACQRNRD